MARLARFVVPGIAHHVTQRGNGRQQTFFSDADYAAYCDQLRELGADAQSRPPDPGARACRRAAGSTRQGSPRLRRTGSRPRATHRSFWQGRFGCVAMDEPHLLAALRYVALNPVRARLAARAQDWRWSSVHALLGRADGITDTAPVLERVPNFAALLRSAEDAHLSEALRRSESTGRPLGSSAFLDQVEATLGRDPKPAKRGPRSRRN